MNTQPNFEKLKTDFYQAFYKSNKADMAILKSTLHGDFRSHYTKVNEFKLDFNKWLDQLDIRQCSTLISILKENEKPVLGWMAANRYFIDYNKYDCLDLIRIENED